MWDAMHEERSDKGTEEVNSETEWIKDNHKIMEDTISKEEKTIRRKNEKRNPSYRPDKTAMQ